MHKWQKVEKSECRGTGGWGMIIIIIIFTTGRWHFKNAEFQVAKHPNCFSPKGPIVSFVIQNMAAFVKDEVMLLSARQASFSSPQPSCFIWEACLWCAHNMKDGGLSASCQLGNYRALLPGATEPAKSAWLPCAQKLCCWWTWLIPRNAGLSSCSSVNDFIQQGEVTRGPVIKALHFTEKTACLCAVL